MILGSQENTTALFSFSPILFSYNSIQSLYTYLSYTVFGTIFHFCFKGKDDAKNKIDDTKNKINKINFKTRIKNKKRSKKSKSPNIFNMFWFCCL